jgi:hypothetical protein
MQSLIFCLYVTTFFVTYYLPKKRETSSNLRYFYIYPLVGSCVTFFIILNAYKLLPFLFVHYINEMSIFFHFTFLSRFMYLSSDRNRLVKSLIIIFLLVIAVFVIYDCINSTFLALSISNAFLFVLGLFYFYTLFKSSPKSRFSRDSSFLICCGIFLGSGVMILAPALQRYADNYRSGLGYLLAVLGNFGFAIMYLFFIKAFLCLPTLRKS